MTKKQSAKIPERLIKSLLIVWIIGGMALLLKENLTLEIKDEQHFSYLAKEFLEGKLYFEKEPSRSGWADTSPYKGRHYWPLGIFSTLVMLIPTALTGKLVNQGYISIILTTINMFLLYKLAKYITKHNLKSWYLSIAYLLGSSYIMVGLTPFSWYFSHVVTTTCLLGAIFFTIIKQKPLLGGSLFAGAFLTRISVSLGIIFFLTHYFLKKENAFKNKSMLNLFKFLIPVISGIVIFTGYNYLRFEHVLETGYRYQILSEFLNNRRELGMWSFKHFPINAFLLFIMPPQLNIFNRKSFLITPNRVGMSFIYTSPIFLYLIKTDFKNKLNRTAGITAFAIAMFLFGTFGMGANQYGYRFALDFQPFLFLILCNVFKKENLGAKEMLILNGSFLFNVYMYFQFFWGP